MPSHLDEPDNKKERPDWVSDTDIMGNNEADRLAGFGANSGELNLNIVRPILRVTNAAKQIQARFASILYHLPNRKRDKHTKAIRVPNPTKYFLN